MRDASTRERQAHSTAQGTGLGLPPIAGFLAGQGHWLRALLLALLAAFGWGLWAACFGLAWRIGATP